MALALGLVAAAVVPMLIAAVPGSWRPPVERGSEAPPRAEVLVPNKSPLAGLPKGAHREPDGYLTILAAARTPAQPQPHPSLAPAAGGSPQPVIPRKLAGGIRLFARLRPEAARPGLVTSDLMPPPQQVSKVVLRDGCFRLAEPGEPHAVFTLGTRLFVDAQGYLAFTAFAPGSPMRARVGEEVWWEGERRELRDRQALAQIRARCGPGRTQIVGLAQSVSVGQILADGMAATRVSAMYGLPWAQALARVRACRDRLSRGPDRVNVTMITTPCGTSPPPPVASPETCPPGTALSGGLCRTPEGYVRPIPPF
jgi:hypothetical protein